jgi:DNA repair exonuclease SbcCD ATPase subunit
MNVKKLDAFIIAAVLILLAAFIADYLGKSSRVRELDRQLSLLNREHGERQRDIEENNRELASFSQDAVTALEGAGEIVERTGGELQRAGENLRDAKTILGGLAVQIKRLQMELDNCRAALYGIRRLSGNDD